MPGGFDAMNDFIRASIHSALLSMRSRFEENFEQAGDVGDVSNAVQSLRIKHLRNQPSRL